MDGNREGSQKHRVDSAEDVKAVADFSLKYERQTGTLRDFPDVIIIEDDESAKAETQYPVHRDDDYDSDANSSGFESCSNRQARLQSSKAFSAGRSKFSGKSYDDDCFVMQRDSMESGPSRLSWHLHRRAPKAEKRPPINVFMTNKSRKSSSSSSDCEIIEDSNGKARQDWEKAALKKRLGSSYTGGSFRAESEESTSAAGSAARRSFQGKFSGHSQQSENKAEPYQSGPSSLPSGKERDTTPVTLLDQQDSNYDCPDARSEDSSDLAGEETSITESAFTSSGNDLDLSEERASCSPLNTPPIEDNKGVLPQEIDCPVLDRQGDDRQHQQVAVEAALNLTNDDLFVDRERVKETEEFRHAEKEEWARRQQELKRQAEEVQRQRKKRKVEAERKLEMESRQKQRLEEIRWNQQKEERNLGYKEQVRGRIRSELEDVAAACKDMASLLRNLGVEVDGGVFPSIQQVNAAYKRALLRFHPDRVAALAKTDPRRQVEAEETFKLISKMKTTLQPVALSYY